MQGLRSAGQSTSGDRMEVDLTKQLLYVIRGGKTVWTVNTSTGSGAFYDEPNQKDGGRISGTAITPVGTFHVYREFSDGWEPGQLGDLYRPKYFTGGVAVHGAPADPERAGVARVRPGHDDVHGLRVEHQPHAHGLGGVGAQLSIAALLEFPTSS